MEWISIKDRLPEGQGTFLAFIPKGRGYLSFAVWMPKDKVDDTYGLYFMEDFGYGAQKLLEEKEQFTREEVTHWMPLPHPPIPKRVEDYKIVSEPEFWCDPKEWISNLKELENEKAE